MEVEFLRIAVIRDGCNVLGVLSIVSLFLGACWSNMSLFLTVVAGRIYETAVFTVVVGPPTSVAGFALGCGVAAPSARRDCELLYSCVRSFQRLSIFVGLFITLSHLCHLCKCSIAVGLGK